MKKIFLVSIVVTHAQYFKSTKKNYHQNIEFYQRFRVPLISHIPKIIISMHWIKYNDCILYFYTPYCTIVMVRCHVMSLS